MDRVSPGAVSPLNVANTYRVALALAATPIAKLAATAATISLAPFIYPQRCRGRAREFGTRFDAWDCVVSGSTGSTAADVPSCQGPSLIPLQAAWGQEIADNSPAIYTNANLKTFIAAAIKAQAVFALDVRTSLVGALSQPIYDQLLAIKP